MNPKFVSQRSLTATLARQGSEVGPPCTQRTRPLADHLLHPSIGSPQRYRSVSSVELFTGVMYPKLPGVARRGVAKSGFSKLNAHLHNVNVLCKLWGTLSLRFYLGKMMTCM